MFCCWTGTVKSKTDFTKLVRIAVKKIMYFVLFVFYVADTYPDDICVVEKVPGNIHQTQSYRFQHACIIKKSKVILRKTH